MPNRKFRVGVYKVYASMDDGELREADDFDIVLSETNRLLLGDRYATLGARGYRLQDCREQNGVLLADIFAFDFAGPGRAQPTTTGGPIVLVDEERFTISNAILYDPARSLLFAESRSRGITHGNIAKYFTNFGDGDTHYLLLPVLDEDAAERAHRFQTVYEIQAQFNASMMPAGHDPAIDSLAKFCRDHSADVIDVTIRVGPQRRPHGTLNANVWDLADRLVNIGNTGGVSRVKIKGKEHDDDATELINLMLHAEKREDALEMRNDIREVGIETRWGMLAHYCRNFHQ